MVRKTINFGVGGGAAYLKIDARTGVFKVKLSESDEVSLSAATFEVDPDSINVGWLAFVKSEGVHFISGIELENKPDPINGSEFRLGVRFTLYCEETLPDIGEPLGLREVATTSFVVRKSVKDLYEQISRGERPGEVPLVKVERFNAITMRNGTAYAPVFEIIDWRPRRVEFGPSEEGPSGANTAQPSSVPESETQDRPTL